MALTHLLNKSFFSASTVNGNSSASAECINGYSLYCIQHIWSGASGSWSVIVEGSNVPGNKTDSDYSAIDTTVISTASGNRLINVERAGYSFVRVRIAYTSGGGTLTSILNAKV
jgi:hypothetical protein